MPGLHRVRGRIRADAEIRRRRNHRRVGSRVISRVRIASTGKRRAVHDARRRVRRHAHRHGNRRIAGPNSQRIAARARQRRQRATPARPANRRRGQGSRQRVHDRNDPVRCRSCRIAHRQCVRRTGLSLIKTTGVRFRHRQVNHLDNRGCVRRRIVADVCLSASGNACGIHDRRRGVKRHVHRQRNRRITRIVCQSIGARATHTGQRTDPACSRHHRCR